MTKSLEVLLPKALERREDLLNQLAAEQTDCYRVFHGTSEGRKGLTIDRYGPQLLIQSFHEPLHEAEQAQISQIMSGHFKPAEIIYYDRSAPNSRRSERSQDDSPLEHVGHELGVKYRVRARHAGQDPLLFLDLRVARRLIQAQSAGKSMLNLFAYTCGAGICAATAGAREVWNIDFAQSSLDVGRENAVLNGLDPESKSLRFVQSDFFTAVRQFAGLPVSQRRDAPRKGYQKMKPHSFDLVLLDPPAWAKSPFGTVDLVRDYQSIFKPALMATAEGGTLICTNNVAQVHLEDWLDQLSRCVLKTGRKGELLDVLTPEPDFPSFDGKPPLKIAVLGV